MAFGHIAEVLRQQSHHGYWRFQLRRNQGLPPSRRILVKLLPRLLVFVALDKHLPLPGHNDRGADVDPASAGQDPAFSSAGYKSPDPFRDSCRDSYKNSCRDRAS